MKKILPGLILILMLTQPGCENKCKDADAPEIEFGLIVRGDVVVYSQQSGAIVTSEWEGLGINVMVNKVYCDGTTRGPFEEQYTIDGSGEMLRSASGYWSFKMNNKNDYMDVDFFCGGQEIGQSAISYALLQPYDGQTARPYYSIEIRWDYQNNSIFSSKVILQ